MKSVIICDMEGVIQEINKGALELFGYNKDELIGKKRVSIFSPGEIVIQNVLGWLETTNKQGKSVVKTNFLRKDGTQFNAEILISSLPLSIITFLGCALLATLKLLHTSEEFFPSISTVECAAELLSNERFLEISYVEVPPFTISLFSNIDNSIENRSACPCPGI